MDETAEVPFPGVRALDHTADVGIEIEAPDLPALLAGAARGMSWLLLEREPLGARSERRLELEAGEPATLVRELLRELLWWHEREGATAVELSSARIEEAAPGRLRLEAVLVLASDPDPPVREIKGVTLHGLVAEPRGSGWYGRVIFDV